MYKHGNDHILCNYQLLRSQIFNLNKIFQSLNITHFSCQEMLSLYDYYENNKNIFSDNFKLFKAKSSTYNTISNDEEEDDVYGITKNYPTPTTTCEFFNRSRRLNNSHANAFGEQIQQNEEMINNFLEDYLMDC